MDGQEVFADLIAGLRQIESALSEQAARITVVTDQAQEAVARMPPEKCKLYDTAVDLASALVATSECLDEAAACARLAIEAAERLPRAVGEAFGN